MSALRRPLSGQVNQKCAWPISRPIRCMRAGPPRLASPVRAIVKLLAMRRLIFRIGRAFMLSPARFRSARRNAIDAVCELQHAGLMGHRKHGQFALEVADGRQHGLFRGLIEIAGGLVEDQQPGLWTSARAIASRWRCPPESRPPRSPTEASRPPFIFSTNSSASAFCSARSTSSRVPVRARPG